MGDSPRRIARLARSTRAILRGWWRRALLRIRTGRGRWLDPLIVVVATSATAAAALVLEDALPRPEGGERYFDPPRIGWLVASVALLVVAVIRRQRIARTAGTLYYIRHLHEWMDDWRLTELEIMKRRYLDRRVIGVWSTAIAERGAIDVSAEVERVATELQRSMNDDRIDTGFNLAPNLLLPFGIALGYHLYRWEGLTFEELFSGPGGAFTSLSWGLPAGDDPRGDHPWWCFVQPSTRCDVLTDVDAGAVLVTADFTEQGETTTPPGRYRRHYRAAVFSDRTGKARGSASRLVRVTTQTPTGVEELGFDYSAVTAKVHPWDAVRATTGAIRRALHENPEQAVVLALRVPKTVAVGIGWSLANAIHGHGAGPCGMRGCKQPSCLHPWSRIVVALLDQESSQGGYVLTRVMSGQPPVDVLLSRVFGEPDDPLGQRHAP